MTPIRTVLTAVLALLLPGAALAQPSVKIGLILPMTGPFQGTGRQIDAAVKLYMQQHGDTVAGDKVEVILRDDGGVPDTSKRLAQELVVRDHVNVLFGFGLTPIALAVAPIATQAKMPEIVISAGTSSVTQASPFIVRTGAGDPADGDHDGAVGVAERHQEGGDGGQRLRPRPRRGEMVQRHVQGRRRHHVWRRCACRWPIRISRRSCSA